MIDHDHQKAVSVQNLKSKEIEQYLQRKFFGL